MSTSWTEVTLPEGTLRVTRHYRDWPGESLEEPPARHEAEQPTWTLNGQPITRETALAMVRKYRRNHQQRDEDHA